MLGIIIAIGIFAILFPGLFDFILSILSGIWNIIGTIVMFFVGLISKLNFSAVGDGIDAFLKTIDKVITPIRDILPDSPVVAVILMIVLGVLWVALDRDQIGNMNAYSKLTFAWCATSLNLGLVIAGSGHPNQALNAVIDDFFTDYPMTLQNFTEWHGFAKTMLVFTLLGGLFTLVLFTRAGGIRSFIRTLSGYGFCGMLGYVYMNIRLFVFAWLAEHVGIVGRLIVIPIGLMETLAFIAFFFGIVVFLLPSGAIATINAARAERVRSTARRAMDDDDDIDFDSVFAEKEIPFPLYVSDDEGNHYNVSKDGDFMYIYLPNGDRLSTKWEDVKGSPYFSVGGKRFFPHS